MLTAAEIRDAISHDRATGQRAVGHFDHDAKKNTGPTPYLAVGFTDGPLSSSLECDTELVSLEYTSHEISETGEVIYE